MPARRQAGLKNKGEMLLKKGNDVHPSLRRHYPDQVYGFDLRLPCHAELVEAGKVNTPGNTERTSGTIRCLTLKNWYKIKGEKTYSGCNFSTHLFVSHLNQSL
jgi:hypothetical protein